NLSPAYRPATDLFMVLRDNAQATVLPFYKLVYDIQKVGVNVATCQSDKDAGDLYKTVEKLKIPFIAFVDAETISSGELTIKNMQTREEHKISTKHLSEVKDIDTRNVFADVGKNDPSLLDIALVAIHDSETNEYSTYLVEDLPKLWPIIERADMLIGFNSDHFDIPLLNKYYPGDLTKIKSLDILKEIQKSYGRRMKLDQLAEGTLGDRKSVV